MEVSDTPAAGLRARIVSLESELRATHDQEVQTKKCNEGVCGGLYLGTSKLTPMRGYIKVDGWPLSDTSKVLSAQQDNALIMLALGFVDELDLKRSYTRLYFVFTFAIIIDRRFPPRA